MPQSTPAEGLRLAAAMTSAPKADGDAADFLVLTNIAPGEVSLEGVKIVAWNAKKNTEASPSLTYVFDAGVSLLPGASLKIEGTSFPAGGKLTNSQVGLRIYAADGTTLVQDVFLDADWWNGACDGTGEYFVAKTFGAEAKNISQWAPSRRVDWPDDPDTEITETTTAAARRSKLRLSLRAGGLTAPRGCQTPKVVKGAPLPLRLRFAQGNHDQWHRPAGPLSVTRR